MNKTAIFGGSFDPPHKAHIEIISHLMQTFSRVIVVPAFISPFKPKGSFASGKNRLEMIKIALSQANLTPEISDIELKRGGVSFSYQTVQHYLQDNQKMYFVIGSESIATLHLWKNADWLRQNIIFYVLPRENFTPILRDDFSFEVSPFWQKDYSSSLFKAANAFDKGQEIVCSNVHDYIQKNRFYDSYKQFTSGFKVFGMTQKRINHTYRAIKKGIMLAKIHGEDIDKTIISLILHDIAKYSSAESLTAMGITPSDTTDIPEKIKHAVYGADVAAQYFKIQDKDILNAIYYHTTGRENMSRLEKITAIADYIEEGRTFEGRESLEETAKSNLDMAMAQMLKGVVEFLTKNGREVFKTSQKALSFYNNLVYNKYYGSKKSKPATKL